MPIHFVDGQHFHGPLIAFAVALGLAALGRFLRIGVLVAAAGGAGVVAGWYSITGRFWVFPPPVSVDGLTELAAVALLIGLLCAWRGQERLAVAAVPLAALLVGWFITGAPRNLAVLRADWPTALGGVLATIVFARALTGRALDPTRLALAALTLAAALHLAGPPSIWVQMALVPGLAALAMFALPAAPGLAALPVAVDVAALACLSVIALGRLPRLGFAPVDAAALSPLLALWLMPRAVERLGRAGRAAPLAGSLLAGAIAVGCVWVMRALLHR
jgi:hypothetical protein